MPGSALVGPGPSEVRELLPWDGPAMAGFLGGSAPEERLAAHLRACDAAIAFTRRAEVAARLRVLIPRVIVRDPEPGEGHASPWLAEAARDLGAVADPLPPDLEPTPEEREAARPFRSRLPPRFLALHPGSGSTAKNWPADRFAALARGLAPSRPWLLVSGPADEAATAALGAGMEVVLAAGLPPRGLGALLAYAGLFVGNDSGVSHLAAAFGAPTLALFGPTEPSAWAPVGRRVRVVRSPDRAMAGLREEAVLREAREFVR
jgi:ADP-heptose:LPS heptosyltransferase